MQFLIRTATRTDIALDLSNQIIKSYKGFLLSINLVNSQDKWILILSFRDLPDSDSPDYKSEARTHYIIESAKIIHHFQIMNHFSVAFAGVESDLLSEILACVDKLDVHKRI